MAGGAGGCRIFKAKPMCGRSNNDNRRPREKSGMQIGHGKQGIIFGEYGCSRPNAAPEPKRQVGASEASSDKNAILGWLEPACDSPGWIIWFTRQGDVLIYPVREASGAVKGEPIRLSSDVRKQEAVYYGPHACGQCGLMICRMGSEYGSDSYTYPEGPIYPNTDWSPHVCQQRDIERVNGLLSIGFRRPSDLATQECPAPSCPPKSDNSTP